MIGVPTGWFVGTYAWRLLANGLGVSITPTIPVIALFLTIPATIAVCNVIAMIPARTAVRTRPAIELRSQ